MNLTEALSKLKAAIAESPEAVIAAAEEMSPHISEVIAKARIDPGDPFGVATIACRFALRGNNDEETASNIIQFTELLYARRCVR